jgi:hypothetical protein
LTRVAGWLGEPEKLNPPTRAKKPTKAKANITCDMRRSRDDIIGLFNLSLASTES